MLYQMGNTHYLSAQVIERLIADWCATPAAPTSPSPPGGSDGGAGPTSPSGQRAMAPEAVPGFRRFAIEHFAGEACVSGLLRAAAGGLFDVRDSATISLLGEVRHLLHSKILYPV